ncbi:hypothetical protein N7532_010139 [Penicillium argentinense]|uniref:PHD-type domain-containing protein n=1 Tax=Penicillium argentinense TaxID=1131581 RepID=A0A9W9EP16_9EURO|nr:uncharacterized protein N7532_010139 [Penicillium argentinense]KAJ5085368.1 hypothetical protein N7532_010139 [Penicillium argentinense]
MSPTISPTLKRSTTSVEDPELADRPGKRPKIAASKELPQEDAAVKNEDSAEEVLPATNTTRISRSGRAIKAPTAYAPSPAPVSTKRHKPGTRKRTTNIVCAKCDRGTSPKSNPIVFCDGCEATWHQKCHDPIISDEVITDEAKEWHCYACDRRRRRSNRGKLQESTAPVQQEVVLGPKDEANGAALKRAYFGSLTHIQLVDLLVDISFKHPELNIGPPNVLQKTVSPKAASPKVKADAEDEEGYRKHPRAGNGFALPQGPEDLDILQEDPESTTFSHLMNFPVAASAGQMWRDLKRAGNALFPTEF